MEPTEPQTPKADGQHKSNSGRTRRSVARNLYWAAAITAGLSLVSISGFFGHRTDPFASWPGFWQWLTKPQPHAALAAMPVLPMGTAGTLSWRPASTAWITQGYAIARDVRPPSAAELLGITAANAQSSVAAPPAAQQPPPPSAAVQGDKSSRPAGNTAQQPATTFIPPLSANAALLALPAPAPMPTGSESSSWAACDATGKTCLRVFNNAFQLSTDGGLRWASKTIKPPRSDSISLREMIIAAAGRLYLGSGDVDDNGVPILKELVGENDDINTRPTDLAPLQSSVDALLDPFQLFETTYLARRASREQQFKQSGGTVAAARADVFLQDSGLKGKAAVAGVMADEPSGMVLLALLSKGMVVRSQWLPEANNPERLTHRTEIINLNTAANLRSMHFQPGGKIGWISSGWNDGNEEGPLPAVFQTLDGGKTWARLSYSALPAPLALYFAMPALLLAFFVTGAAWVDYRSATIDQGIAGAGTSDAPIGWNDPDILDIKPLALALSRFVRNTHTAPPLTIAVTGPWGTGKSSLMNLIAEDLRLRGASPVWFNAWHHQKEEHILAALLENIRGQAIPPVWRLSGLLFRGRLLARRMGKDVVPLLFAIALVATLALAADLDKLKSSLVTLLVMIPTFNQGTVVQWFDKVVGVGAGAIALLVLKAYGTLKLRPSELMATLRGNAKLADFSAQLGFRYKFAKEFDAAGRALRTRSNPGLVIFIDDLDRCAPGNLMEVLESINFLATAGPCFIFLGMDEPKVIEIVAKQLDGQDDRARQYLKKLINLTVPVPDVDVLKSVGLSTGAGTSAAPASAWPKRIRAVLRAAPDSAVPALTMIAIVGLVATQLSMAPNTVPGPATAQQDTQRTGTTVNSTGTNPPSSAAPTAPAADVPPPIQTAQAGQLVGSGRTWSYIGIILVLVVVLLLLARRMTAVREDQIEDSQDFRGALGVWHPAVFASDPTPRGVKRHQNRLRLQAMRLRPFQEEPDLIDRWLVRDKPTPVATSDIPIGEPTLVALGAIEALCGTIPDWAVQRDLAAASVAGDAALIIVQCREQFISRFPEAWPPTRANIDAFRALGRSLRN